MEPISSQEISSLRDEMSLLWKEINELRKSKVNETATLQWQITILQQQLNEQIQINKILIRKVEQLSLAKDLAYRLKALEEFISLTVDQETAGKLSASHFHSSFIPWTIGNKGLFLSDDEVKYLMRTYFKVPKQEQAKFPHRGHDDYFYKGLKLKEVFGISNELPQVQPVVLPQLDLQSPVYKGASSPAPVMSRQ